MSRYSLDYLRDSMMTLDAAEFLQRHGCTQQEAQAFITTGALPNGWQKPRSTLFRLAAALSIAEFVKREPTPEQEQDMAECAAEGLVYPTMREQAFDL